MKKRIIVCCDGTWNDLEMRYITNVGRLVQGLLPEGKSGTRPISQLVFYDDGIGADAGGFQRLLQGGFGAGIDNLIYEAYRFVCVNYERGDEICLFGFSRGAFTVRSVAGMIAKVGLVPRKKLKHVPEALKAYRSKDDKVQQAFKGAHTYGDQVKITLLGCWDTVGALGIPDKIPLIPIDNLLRKRYEFHNTELGTQIERALHAVSIDERRKEFEATLMQREAGNTTTQLVQTWFPGDHGCVGGGSWEKRGMSNHCLRWMIDEAHKMGVGIGVDWTRLHDHAMADHSIFFSKEMKFIYGTKNRPLPGHAVAWDDIDETARLRWVEHYPSPRKHQYRPPALERRFSAELNALALDTARHPPAAETRLEVGASADLRIFAETKHNPSRIKTGRGDRYEIEVSRLQVWKDKDFDPCDIQGWNVVSEKEAATKGIETKLPYEGGEQMDRSAVKSKIIQLAKRWRLVPHADWFELVASLDGKDYFPLGIKKPAKETQPFKMKLAAQSDGELHFAVNDAASRLDVFDKYDNNAGWVWIKVTRIK